MTRTGARLAHLTFHAIREVTASMNTVVERPSLTSSRTEEEWATRRELAACYRLVDQLGWAEGIFNHITARVPSPPGAGPHYLINPFGLHYCEVTPENLVKIDLDGHDVEASGYGVNRAGFVIHGAIHGARDDAHCVVHVHTTAGCAVSCKESGLRHDNFYSAMLVGEVAYHDYEGVTTGLDEQPRLIASLGRAAHLILRNHGLLVVGRTLPQAFKRLWTLQRACEVQLASDAGAGPNRAIPPTVLERVSATQAGMQQAGRADNDELLFDAMLRRHGIAFQRHA
jgi:ribulose-5-phosphate 4-epimerase/fuculose-1-phosphate aldolase